MSKLAIPNSAEVSLSYCTVRQAATMSKSFTIIPVFKSKSIERNCQQINKYTAHPYNQPKPNQRQVSKKVIRDISFKDIHIFQINFRYAVTFMNAELRTDISHLLFLL